MFVLSFHGATRDLYWKYELNNSKTEIVCNCNFDTDAAYNTINKDPPGVFKNVEFPMCLEDEYVFDVQQRGGNPFLFTIAFFRESQTQMTSVTIKTLIIT